MNIDKYKEISELANKHSAKLIAVSKTKPITDIQQVYDAGQRIFGENRAQELADKHPQLPQDIEWHMIGHLQRNKVKYIAPYVAMVHSIDSFRLLKEVNKEAAKNARLIPCLLQFHIAKEESKYGFSEAEVRELLDEGQIQELKNVQIAGIMGMATFTDDMERVRSEFKELAGIFKSLTADYFPGDTFKEISMGMSGDYEIALEEGATLIRVGSLIFGERQ